MSQHTPVDQKSGNSAIKLPLVIEKDEDGFYIVECPLLGGCYSQGKTLDEALQNIQEVIVLLAEEEEVQETIKNYMPQEISFHTIAITL